MNQATTDTAVHFCLVCGLVYAPEQGLPEVGIPPGTPWAQLPTDWRCPDCGVGKSQFETL